MPYDRDILEKIFSGLSTPDILVILGSRQVGKTTILEIIYNRLGEEKKNCLFLDMDLETNLEYFSSYESIIGYIRFRGYDPGKDSLFLFLDEFHRVQRAGKTLKNLYDHHKNIKIIATGSSSLEINKTISESMSGRKMVFRVFPLNFREFLVFKGADRLLAHFDGFRIGDEFPPVLYKEYEKLMTEKLVFGSFPEVVLLDDLEKKGRKIEDILNSYLRKDIKEQLGIKDTVRYKKVLEFLGITAANLLNTQKIAQELGTYHKKISDLIDIAVETYLVDLVRPFSAHRKREIIKNPKVYFEDAGMRNFLIKNMNLDLGLRFDTGSLVESFVYNELIDKIDVFSEIKFWRTKSDSEIDFLLVRNQAMLPIEVKSGSHTNIPKSLLFFCKREKLSRAVIFNKDVSMKITRDSIDFYFIPFIFSSRVLELILQTA
jgi:predicted AAA+ superfamily ATPase